ncbi:MAG: hypothetical protein OEY19_09240 [Gammaproteobacteria bacterium]|nr:hypothetical protein [Gammaproteobacteria bacterium]MDH5629596.1 hypothetical protein [Gammaproteobacteria bacterium]
MKILLITFVFLFSTFLIAEENMAYKQYSSILITPDYTQLNQFAIKMEHHNKTFHSSGPYRARVFNVVSGSDVGKIYWIMGPSTYSHLDDKPSNKPHNNDWTKNVMPLVTKIEHGEYWREKKIIQPLVDNLSPTSQETEDSMNIWLIRFMAENSNIDRQRFNDLYDRVAETYSATKKIKYGAVLDNYLLQGNKNDRHVIVALGMQKWSDMDIDLQFRQRYEELFGTDSFQQFREELLTIFTTDWQEIWVLNKKMSGME